MRFTRFPRVEQPTQPSARRVAAAKRAVQAEKDRYPLFPELVRYSTTQSRLDAMQEHLACPGRIATTEIDFRRASPKPLETFMVEIAISCDMSQTFGPRMNSDPKQKRERVQQLAQNPKVKTGKVFGADLRKSKIHPTVKKLTAWRKLNRLSQRKAVAVLAKYYFHATFASLRSWEEGRRSPNSHTAAILERFLLEHPSVERPKK
jgi:DNA-binding transcriptional regulator YiaG